MIVRPNSCATFDDDYRVLPQMLNARYPHEHLLGPDWQGRESGLGFWQPDRWIIESALIGGELNLWTFAGHKINRILSALLAESVGVQPRIETDCHRLFR